MIGKYERSDGTRFDVIHGRNGTYQRGDEKSIGKNRLFVPVIKAEIEQELKDKLITKI
jgi:hypothetical protein